MTHRKAQKERARAEEFIRDATIKALADHGSDHGVPDPAVMGRLIDTILEGPEYRTNEEFCPHCGANFQGDPIPEESQHLYGATHYSRKIGIYDQVRDRTVEWMCPDCGARWER